MTDQITPSQFDQAEGVEDWRLTSEGATAFFRTRSFAESAQFVLVRAACQSAGDSPAVPANAADLASINCTFPDGSNCGGLALRAGICTQVNGPTQGMPAGDRLFTIYLSSLQSDQPLPETLLMQVHDLLGSFEDWNNYE